MKSITQIVRASLAVALFTAGPVTAMAATESSAAHPAPKATTSSVAPAIKKVVRIIGNTETKKYHKPSCRWVKEMNKENRVAFASAAEAKKAGYEPCQVCLGEKAVKKTAASGVPVKKETPPGNTQ